MASEPKTLQEAILYFADFENCRAFMVSLRWPDGVVKCPRCGSEKVTWLANARVWKCYAKHESPTFTLKTGTIFEDSPIPLEKWLPAVWLIVTCKNGISSYEAARDLGISQKSAWHMNHRIRFALHHGSFEKFSGHVEADETFIGGKARNMHAGKRAHRITGTGGKDKTAVMGILERGGKVKTVVIPVILFAGLVSAQGTTTNKNTTAPAETPEHKFARTQYELGKHEFDETKKDYDDKFKQNPDCQVFDTLITHPATVDSVDEHMVGCNYETRKARYVMEKVSEALVRSKARLDHVDDCLKVYLSTIDKKLSDQTQREVGQIKTCQSDDLYPPRTR